MQDKIHFDSNLQDIIHIYFNWAYFSYNVEQFSINIYKKYFFCDIGQFRTD